MMREATHIKHVHRSRWAWIVSPVSRVQDARSCFQDLKLAPRRWILDSGPCTHIQDAGYRTLNGSQEGPPKVAPVSGNMYGMETGRETRVAVHLVDLCARTRSAVALVLSTKVGKPVRLVQTVYHAGGTMCYRYVHLLHVKQITCQHDTWMF